MTFSLPEEPTATTSLLAPSVSLAGAVAGSAAGCSRAMAAAMLAAAGSAGWAAPGWAAGSAASVGDGAAVAGWSTDFSFLHAGTDRRVAATHIQRIEFISSTSEPASQYHSIV